MSKTSLLVVFTLFISLALSLHEIPLHARGGSAWRQHVDSQLVHSSVELKESIFTQLIDHFHQVNDTFPQRYFSYVSPRFTPGNIVFLDICGEGPCSGPSGYSLYLTDKYNAAAFALEHRFYGKSVPNNDMSVNGLKHLNLEEAMADLSSFIDEVITPSYPHSPIVVVGGSYAGGVSSWFRTIYPEKTCAALSSSGVVNAIFDFTEFDTRVGIAAGAACKDKIVKATRAIRYFWDNHQSELKEIFGLHHHELKIAGDFFYMIADSSAMAIQYGVKEEFCNGILSVDDKDIVGLVKTYSHLTMKIWGSDFPSNCFYDTQCLTSNPNLWQPTSRAWRWQKCNQLAYLQSQPVHNPIRDASVNMTYMLNQCESIFGKENTIENTEIFNTIFGGAEPKASNVFYSDFSDDPWQEASVLKNLTNNQPYEYVVCEGCGHCKDLHTPSVHDPQPLKNGRARFEKWLERTVKSC